MNANLVRAASVDFHFDERELAESGVEPTNDLVM